MIASRNAVLFLLPLFVACGPGLIGSGGSMFEGEGSELPANMTLDDSEFTDTLPIDFPRTYASQSEYFHHAGVCSMLASNMGLALITIARQLHHDTVNVIDPSGVYQTGADKRLYIADMGGCPETNPDSPDYNPYEHHHDDGGNFHKGTRVSDFLYFTREANNCTQSNCNGLGHTSLYDSNQLIEDRVDWLRMALFLRYLNEVFPQANIMIGTQLKAYISEMLRTRDPALRGLLEQLALDDYTPRAQGNDAYNHPHHMHVGFSASINWDNFAGDHWYFNSSEDGSYQLVDARTIVRSGNHSILYPIHNAAGAFGGYPQRCDGAFEINTRGAIWESECATDWQQLTQPECDELGLECPRTSGADTLPTNITCIGRTCMGIDSFVDEIRRPDGTSNRDGLAPEDYQRYCCSGLWRVDATANGNPADWENGCSTGWHKVGIAGEPNVTPFGTLVQFQQCSAPEAPNPPSVADCVDALCTGANATVFPVVNGDGRFNPYPATCVGHFTIDVRGSSWTSSCNTEWVVTESCERPGGGSFTNCPYEELEEPPVEEPECSVTVVCPSGFRCETGVCVIDNECVDDNCGTPSCSLDSQCAPGELCDHGTCVAVDPMCATETDCAPNELCNSGVCVAFDPTCGNDAECAPDQQCEDGLCVAAPATPTVASCINARCSGYNAVVFPVVNGDGRSNIYPATCTGEYVIDVRDDSWSSSCTTSWVVANSCDRPNGSNFANCPYPQPVDPPAPSADSCVNTLCSGSNSVVFPVVNGDNRSNLYPATCFGDWVIDVRGSSWSSSCSTGWVVESDCDRPDSGSFNQCPYPQPEPEPVVDLPAVRSCISSLCSGSDTVVFPVANAANTSNPYPATCTGSYTIDVRGGSWTSTCSTDWEVATSCERPDGGTFANCPYPTTNTFNEVSCVDNFCRGSNSDVHPVANATGMSNGDLIATCTGSWWINARGSAWESHCDTGWTTR